MHQKLGSEIFHWGSDHRAYVQLWLQHPATLGQHPCADCLLRPKRDFDLKDFRHDIWHHWYLLICFQWETTEDSKLEIRYGLKNNFKTARLCGAFVSCYKQLCESKSTNKSAKATKYCAAKMIHELLRNMKKKSSTYCGQAEWYDQL